ncbi:MAG: cell division protein ZapA [Bacteroidales bacterium]|jgi:cell division protein ZapA|nr:cell division protein ZapA [Bacteroidales bacterium]
MSENEKLSITLKILDRSYPLKVEWSDEEKFRKSAERINDLAKKFESRFGNKNDNQDFLAMVALQFAHKIIELEQHTAHTTSTATLEKICEELDEFIKTNQ